MEIGVRELRSNLANVLERAAAGERIVITERGTPKAVLGPTSTTDNLGKGIAEGWITPGAKKGTPAPIPRQHFAFQPGWSSERAISEDRGI